MTNREYLNTLSNDKFAQTLLIEISKIETKNFNPELDIFDFTIETEMELEEWLDSEHRE